MDQQDPTSVAGAVAEVVEHLSGLDLVINNAAMTSGGHHVPQGDLEPLTPKIWDQMMAVNMRGPYLVTRAASAYLRRSEWGRVVNIGSAIGMDRGTRPPPSRQARGPWSP
jgi:3-oxoacyl-[acyl-carrier protein] reductase